MDNHPCGMRTHGLFPMYIRQERPVVVAYTRNLWCVALWSHARLLRLLQADTSAFSDFT